MAVSNKISLRHIQVDKAKTLMVVIIAGAAACLVFSLVAAKALWDQGSYNQKVIKEKEATVKQLKSNIKSLEGIKTSYQAFVSEPVNIIGGSSSGTGDRDGDNAKITLDAMPSVYDFPGTMTGFNKMLAGRSFGNVSITGTDDEVNQSINKTPKVVEIPMKFSAKGSAESIQEFLRVLDSSIRPVKVSNVSYTAEQNNVLSVSVDSIIYYQPKKNFEVTTKEVQ